MREEAKKMYDRYRGEVNLPARAAEILNQQGKLTPRRAVRYTENNIRPYFQERYESLDVDLAIIQAGKEIEREQKGKEEAVRLAAAEIV